ncbi:hypothetical protein BGY98DRAFT_231210 [Russula aff. rugulosa BPL654]|nr:hypothetical protein BGY98DRAFT_231210 [Russula aff. rugulosa BPL654]
MDQLPSDIAAATIAIWPISATKIGPHLRLSFSAPHSRLKRALWFCHELGGPHSTCFSLHRFGLQAWEMTITSSLPTRYERTSWSDSQVNAWRTSSRVRSSGWADGCVRSRRPARALGLSSTWSNRKAWYGLRLRIQRGHHQQELPRRWTTPTN